MRKHFDALDPILGDCQSAKLLLMSYDDEGDNASVISVPQQLQSQSIKAISLASSTASAEDDQIVPSTAKSNKTSTKKPLSQQQISKTEKQAARSLVAKSALQKPKEKGQDILQDYIANQAKCWNFSNNNSLLFHRINRLN